MKLLSRVWLFVTPWTVAHQAPPSMEFSRQEYWSGLPFPSPGDLPDPGIEPRSPASQANTLTSEPVLKPHVISSDRPMLQLCVAAQFYLESNGEYILEVWRQANPKDVKRSPQPNFSSSFYMFFPPPPEPVLCKLGYPIQECCFFSLRSSLWSWYLPLFYFCRLFPSFSYHCSGLHFPILTT